VRLHRYDANPSTFSELTTPQNRESMQGSYLEGPKGLTRVLQA
jgi:hypothetical protein